jgi:endonuclease/exonuclease/phosphatase (EEP) superfamily protein YafD
VLMELNAGWIRGLETELRAFPQRIELPRDDAFGIGLYGRGAALEPVELDNPGPPWIVARTQQRGVAFAIAAVHTVPPISARAAHVRDTQLRALARQRSRLGPRALVAGDLNSSSWSPIFRELTAVTKLRDSRQGFGVQGTWTPPLLPLRLPIDHVLVSPGIRVVQREVGADIGSDHRPVFAELKLEP